jgi:hypothetical protein
MTTPETSAIERREAREIEYLSPADRAQADLALQALGALRKTFDHWMVIARFVARMRELANEKGGRWTFQRLLEQNGLGEDRIKHIGGKAIISRLEEIAASEIAVREWHANDLDDEQRFKWASSTSIKRHCPVFRKGDDGVTGTPSTKKRKQLDTAKAVKIELERANTRIHELEEEKRDGSLFDLRQDDANDIAKTIVGTISKHKAKRIADAILNLLKAPAG